jgi:hypothetical protein
MKRYRSHTSKEDIIKNLQLLSEELGKTPTWIECMKLGKTNMSRLIKYFGTFNKALIAAGLPVNRIRAKKTKGYITRNSPRPKHYNGHKPVFTNRVCNVCDRNFQAEDDMRSCPVCTNTKRSAEYRASLSDTAHAVGYLT